MRTGIRRGLRTTLAGTLLFGGLATVSLAAASALTAGTASAVGPVFSSITPGTYTVIVPTGVTYVTITAVGGSGGSDVGDDITGGEGGIVTQNVSVTPGESLTVTVGANGQCAPDSAGCDGLGGSGYGSGGNGAIEGGGGGGSAVVDNGTVIVVAGGGGGAGGGSRDPQGGNADQSGAGSGGGPGTLSGPGGGACVTIPDYFLRATRGRHEGRQRTRRRCRRRRVLRRGCWDLRWPHRRGRRRGRWRKLSGSVHAVGRHGDAIGDHLGKSPDHERGHPFEWGDAVWIDLA